MRDLEEIRKDIDNVDSEILRLYEERLSLADEVAEYKRANDRPILDAKREREKLDKIASRYTDPFMQQAAEELFVQLMSLSRKKQYRSLPASSFTDDGETAHAKGERKEENGKDPDRSAGDSANRFACVKDFDFTVRMAARYGDRIAVGVDTRDGFLAVSGWKDC